MKRSGLAEILWWQLKQASYENPDRLPGAAFERLGFHMNAKQCHSRHAAENNAEKEIRSKRQIIDHIAMCAGKAHQDFFDDPDLPMQAFLNGKFAELRKSSALRGKDAA